MSGSQVVKWAQFYAGVCHQSSRTFDKLMCMFPGTCPPLRPNSLPESTEQKVSEWTSSLECCRWGHCRFYKWSSPEASSGHSAENLWETTTLWVPIKTHSKCKGIGKGQQLRFGNRFHWFLKCRKKFIFLVLGCSFHSPWNWNCLQIEQMEASWSAVCCTHGGQLVLLSSAANIQGHLDGPPSSGGHIVTPKLGMGGIKIVKSFKSS